MAMGTNISVITFDVNGLNAPTKDTDWLNGYKNKTHIYSVYKKPTPDLKHIQTESERMEKYIPHKGEAKEKQQVTYKGNPIHLRADLSAGQKGMAGYISSIERGKSTTKMTIPGKDLIQN